MLNYFPRDSILSFELGLRLKENLYMRLNPITQSLAIQGRWMTVPVPYLESKPTYDETALRVTMDVKETWDACKTVGSLELNSLLPLC